MLHIEPQLLNHPLPQAVNQTSMITTTPHQMWFLLNNYLKLAPLIVVSKPHHRFKATKHVTNCETTLLQKPLKITWCCWWSKNLLSHITYSINLFNGERLASPFYGAIVDHDVVISSKAFYTNRPSLREWWKRQQIVTIIIDSKTRRCKWCVHWAVLISSATIGSSNLAKDSFLSRLQLTHVKTHSTDALVYPPSTSSGNAGTHTH